MDLNDSIRQQFGRAAADYAVSAVHRAGPDLYAMLAAAPIASGSRVLDVGCGAGHTALAFAARGASVVALDLTPAMLETTRRLAAERGLEVAVELGAAEALPFPEQSFDVVSCRLCAHHFADPAAAVREAARVLRPGGSYLLVDTVAPESPALDTFLNAFEILRDPSHVRDHRTSEWCAMFARAGLGAEVEGRWIIRQGFDDWVRRMATPAVAANAIRALFDGATAEARATFGLSAGSHDFDLEFALLRGHRLAA
jgi:SAM-dependent methyltransferase